MNQLHRSKPSLKIAEFMGLEAHRLTGGLDLAALEQSFKAIVDRHKALRTTFDLR